MKGWMNRMYGHMDAWGEKLDGKEIHVPIDLTVGVVFSVVAAFVLLIMPYQVAVSEKDVINGRAFPILLTVVMLICCLALVGKEFYKLATKQELRRKTINLLVEVKALILLAILVGTYLLCRITTLFVVGAIFCSIGFLLYFRCQKKSYYAITIVVAIVIWLVFRFGLGVDF